MAVVVKRPVDGSPEGLLSASNSELVFGTRWSRSETLETPPTDILARRIPLALDWIEMSKWSKNTNFIGLSLTALEPKEEPNKGAPSAEASADSTPVKPAENAGNGRNPQALCPFLVNGSGSGGKSKRRNLGEISHQKIVKPTM